MDGCGEGYIRFLGNIEILRSNSRFNPEKTGFITAIQHLNIF